MKVAPIADVKARLSAYLEQAGRTGPVVITKNGRAVAVLIAPEDDEDLESLVLSRSPRFQQILARSRRSIAQGRGVLHHEFWRRAGEPAPKRQRPAR